MVGVGMTTATADATRVGADLPVAGRGTATAVDDSHSKYAGLPFRRHWKRLRRGLCVALVTACGVSHQAEAAGYDFSAAAQELTQLYWLAETAQLCGWTSATEAGKFKLFATRFLGAHLTERDRSALSSLIGEADYEERVRLAASENATANCGNNRWYRSWIAYKTAADEHEAEY